jgi:hypothetical protein
VRRDSLSCIECGRTFPDVRIAAAHQREVHSGSLEHPHQNSPQGGIGKLLGPQENT